jgi:hypothetical protein
MTERFAAVALACLLAAACADGPAGPSGSFDTRVEREDAAFAELRHRAGIRIPLVEGPPIPMARLLAESVAEELNVYNVPATTDMSAEGPFLLRGRTEVNTADPNVPFIVLIHWTLLDRDGNAVGTHIQGVEGSRWQWDYGDPRIIRTAGRNAAKAFATLIQGNDDILMPLELHRAGLIVAPVQGASGDGNAALTIAITEAMRGAGVAMTEDPRQAAYILNGRVTTAPPIAGRSRIRIDWTVATFDGTPIGRATQENEVPSRLLRGNWAEVAPRAAESAVEGIRVMLAPPRRSRRGRVVPPMPPSQEAPEAPGRAPAPDRKLPEAPDRGPPPPSDLPRIPGRAPPPE